MKILLGKLRIRWGNTVMDLTEKNVRVKNRFSRLRAGYSAVL
jgi:hypothetical protein